MLADTMGRQRIVRSDYDQLWTNKMDNLEEMDAFQRNVQPTKSESWGNRKSEQIND